MADPNIFDAVRIPSQVLIDLDWRTYHFAFQPYHYLIRMAHILAMAAFYGAIGFFDFRLMGFYKGLPRRTLAKVILPWVYATFAVAVITGIALFLYDPVRIGSRAYWTPKLIAVFLGVLNAAIIQRRDYLTEAESGNAGRIKRTGAYSLLLWTAALIFACLNTEAMPKLLLQ